MSLTMREEQVGEKPSVKQDAGRTGNGQLTTSELHTSAGATAAQSDPHTRRFFQTPFVTAVDDYQQSGAGKEAEQIDESCSHHP
jgi:hypothetical protein